MKALYIIYILIANWYNLLYRRGGINPGYSKIAAESGGFTPRELSETLKVDYVNIIAN